MHKLFFDAASHIATIKSHPKIRPKKEKRKNVEKDREAVPENMDVDDENPEKEKPEVIDKRRSKKGLKLSTLLRDRDKESKKEKSSVNAYLLLFFSSTFSFFRKIDTQRFA